jgi:beta-glucanase (GH16 family)
MCFTKVCLFYKGILEFGVRSQTHNTGDITVPREYVMDWKRDAIEWFVDGVSVRRYRRDGPESVTAMTPRGERSYPTEPTQVQIGLWDGGSSTSQGTRDWAGGPIPWGDRRELSAR